MIVIVIVIVIVMIRVIAKENHPIEVEIDITEIMMTLETAIVEAHAMVTLVPHHLMIRPMTIITVSEGAVQDQEGPITQ